MNEDTKLALIIAVVMLVAAGGLSLLSGHPEPIVGCVIGIAFGAALWAFVRWGE